VKPFHSLPKNDTGVVLVVMKMNAEEIFSESRHQGIRLSSNEKLKAFALLLIRRRADDLEK
jgi:hypothetical protein